MKFDFNMAVNEGGVKVVEAVLRAFFAPPGLWLVGSALLAWFVLKWAGRL